MAVYPQMQQGNPLPGAGIGQQGFIENGTQGRQYQHPQNQVDQEMIEKATHWPRICFLKRAKTAGCSAANFCQSTGMTLKLPILAMIGLAGIPCRAG